MNKVMALDLAVGHPARFKVREEKARAAIDGALAGTLLGYPAYFAGLTRALTHSTITVFVEVPGSTRLPGEAELIQALGARLKITPKFGQPLEWTIDGWEAWHQKTRILEVP